MSTFGLLLQRRGRAENPESSRHFIFSFFHVTMKKNQKAALKLQDLKVESFITTLDPAKAKRIVGGYASHPTHTTAQDTQHICG